MTSREIILRNLGYDNPPRPGLNFDRGRRDDLLLLAPGPPVRKTPGNDEADGKAPARDEWGNLRRPGGSGILDRGGVVQPALADWGDLAGLRVPDYAAAARYTAMRAAFQADRERFRLAALPGWIFTDACDLRGLELYLADLILRRAKAQQLHELIADLYAKALACCAEAGADGIAVWEDWGGQSGPLIGQAMWREIFAPHYKRLFDQAHALGLKVFFHSCGRLRGLLDEMIAAGVDCFQFDQVLLHNQEVLAAKLREHRVGLWAPLDTQRVLPTGDRRLIEAEVQRMAEAYRGGLIFKNYQDLQSIGVREEWDDWAYEAMTRECDLTPGL